MNGWAWAALTVTVVVCALGLAQTFLGWYPAWPVYAALMAVTIIVFAGWAYHPKV